MNITTPIKTVDEDKTVIDRMTKNAVENILPARYLLKDENGELKESPEELFSRVAENVAKAEETETAQAMWADEFEHLMSTLQFMPNSPTLMNAGASLQQLSACFVIEPRDDMEDIFKKAKDAALIFQSGGGVGYSFSHLRPKGALVSSTKGEASGPVSFMKVFDETCNQVKQGGKRRGAQMGILRVDHPDIGRFATAKRREGEFSNFNISAALTDDFIEAVRNDEEYTLYSPQSDYEEPFIVRETVAQFYNAEYENNPADSFSQKKGDLVKTNFWRDFADEVEEVEEFRGEIQLEPGEPMTLPAKFIWAILVDGAHKNGEPGLFHYDETNRKHSFDVDEYPEHAINATNPCAEQPLSEYEACNLGHINLSLILKEDAPTYEEFKRENNYVENAGNEARLVSMYFDEAVDKKSLFRVIQSGTRFLDNVVTMSDFPLEEIEERVDGQRKIGLGIMGFAQMLFQMGIPYGSDESYEMAQNVMHFIDYQSVQASHELAKERGNFEYWDESKYANPTEYPEWFSNHTYQHPEEWEDGFPMRNHNTTTIAPTGTTSMLANTSGGCEPVYNVANFKNVGGDIQGDDMLVEFDDYFLRVLEANDIDVEAVKEEAETLMRNNEFEGVEDLPVPQKIADIFVTTQDLSSRQHTMIQRAFQEYVDSGISKTINLPHEATHDDVAEAYMLALDEDEFGAPIKGMTVYRDGSRDEQVLTTRVDNGLEKDNEYEETLARLHAEGRISTEIMAELGYEEGDTLDCPECEDGELIVSESCKLCMDCGFSPCG